MAKKKRSSKNTRKSRNKAEKIDLAIIIMIVVSILLAVFIYLKSGTIGEKLSELLGGVMGVSMYILPVGALMFSLKVAVNGRDDMQRKIIQYVASIFSISVFASIYQIVVGTLDTTATFNEIVNQSFNIGTNGQGGGALGALAAYGITNLLGNVGAIILGLGIIAVMIVSLSGVKLSDLINRLYEYKEDKKEEMQEERIKARNIRKEERVVRQEEKKETKRLKRSLYDEEVGEPEQIRINYGGAEAGVISTDEILAPSPAKVTKSAPMPKYEAPKEEVVEKIEKQPNPAPESLFSTQEEVKKDDKQKEILQLEHGVEVEDEHYEYPPLDLLSPVTKKNMKSGTKALEETANKLQSTLHSFGVSAKVENVSVGPAITRYELKPAVGVRVNKIANLSDDIALNLAAETIRIEAPIPGKQAVGIEVPNQHKEMVTLREVLESDTFQNNESKLSIALGKDVSGNTQLADIAKMPHVLIAGSTGSGKSVCINTIITSIIYKSKPSEVKLVMIDPKVVELSVYNGIPHLLIPVVTEPKKAAGALAWAVHEMDDRYNKFAEKGVRDLKGYNASIEDEDGSRKMPQIVIIIDELADLMMVAAKEVEESICRLAQKARAAGMHLVIATQRPSVDVITGLIKANVPSRVAFAVSSQVDSRTILDSVGAEKLLGKGDMLYFPAGSPKPSRVQGAFLNDTEVEKIVNFVKAQGTASYSQEILESIAGDKTKEKSLEVDDDDDSDAFLEEAIQVALDTKQASTSFIQRKFKVGYARAGRIIDQMEERGVISGYQGSKPREVIMTKERWAELNMGAPVEDAAEEVTE